MRFSSQLHVYKLFCFIKFRQCTLNRSEIFRSEITWGDPKDGLIGYQYDRYSRFSAYQPVFAVISGLTGLNVPLASSVSLFQAGGHFHGRECSILLRWNSSRCQRGAPHWLRTQVGLVLCLILRAESCLTLLAGCSAGTSNRRTCCSTIGAIWNSWISAPQSKLAR